MAELEQWLQAQYQSLPHHNYGWWLTTREHQDVAILVTTVQYLCGRFGGQAISLSDNDYNQLQRVLGRAIPSNGAKTVINRHLLLNMWRPLGLLERARTGIINPFWLTDRGLELAQAGEPRKVLESILREIRFVDTDWTRPTVIASYDGISVRPHRVLSTVLEGVEGYLTREEYRLFVSRMRSDDEPSLTEAMRLIEEFRAAPESTRNRLLALEAPLFPGTKSYQNWTDMDLHTFSLFALGTRFRRNGTVLVLSGRPVDAIVANSFVFPEGTAPVEVKVPEVVRSPRRRQVALRTPKVDPALDLPPAPSIQANNGQEAEGFVSRLLEANGFEVRDFSRFRGYGFDLWARHPAAGVAYYCEVKSSTGYLGTIEFTRLEIQAAEQYRDRYIVFCVEQFVSSASTGEVRTVQDPWGHLPAVQTPKTTTTHSAPRSEWLSASNRLE